MIVEEIMQRDLHLLSPEDKIGTALQLFRDKKIRHVPIVDDKGELVGIVTDRDVKDSTPSILKKDLSDEELNKPLSVIMQKDVFTGHPLDFVEDIAATFYEYKIGCMPIVQGGEVIGIVTESDVLRTFVELTGVNQPGSRIEIQMPHKQGQLFEAIEVLNKRRVQIQSVLVYPDKKKEDSRIVVFRIRTMNPTGVIDDLKKDGYNVRWPNMPGMDT
ncbi:acetoin utilization AcuB family protein [Bacillus thermotolerans]|uniref:CBS domain protein AcuB n=1 Tax=Bacillus thermotolerans TaxID=1221996 RepID=A0A0F5IDK8_BACTR|nr:acetoin utilization AcuB family protein [Bacillus thermotolerans]KKB37563.1 CBS domain protein AcuB [Bacillus thermotolerans]KKB42208.1 CBS domain protein AcuB [Bacillus thermotolerans]KKB43262.1 CBS domain protein AcuB [Bacillus thermotolerans]